MHMHAVKTGQQRLELVPTTGYDTGTVHPAACRATSFVHVAHNAISLAAPSREMPVARSLRAVLAIALWTCGVIGQTTTVSTLSALRNALSSSDAHIVVAPGSGPFNLGGTPLDVAINTVIEGNGVELNAGGSSRAMVVTIATGSVSISGVTFRGGDTTSLHASVSGTAGGYGGGLMVASTASVTLDNCVFRDSSADYSGGGLFTAGASMVTNTRFVSCSSRDLIVSEGGGGVGVGTTGNFTCIGCSFESCTAARIGGGVWAAGVQQVAIYSSFFTSCRAGTAGSADSLSGAAKGGAMLFDGSYVWIYDTVISGCATVTSPAGFARLTPHPHPSSSSDSVSVSGVSC